MAIAILGDIAYAAIRIPGLLAIVRSEANSGAEALGGGDIALARVRFVAAREAAYGARTVADHPGPALLSLVPFLGADAGAVRALARAAVGASEAGLQAIEVAGANNSSGDLLSGLYSGGAVQLDAALAMEPRLEAIHVLLRRAEDRVARAPTPHIGAIREAVAEAELRLEEATDAAGRAKTLVGALPELFGGTGSRRYLLLFQSPSEARPTGGFVGLLGVLTAKEGRVSLGETAPPSGPLQTGTAPPVQAPAWFKKRYEPFLGNRSITQANFSPHFPVASEVMRKLYEEESGRRLDGVIAMDPIALEFLTEATGAIDVPGLPPVGPDNAAEVLLHDSYNRFPDSKDQNIALGAIVDELWGRISEGEVDSFELGSALASAVRTQHLKLFARRPELQADLTRLGVAGNFTSFGPNVQLIYNINLAASKVDYFLHRSIDTVVELDHSGNAHFETTVVLKNKAPDGPPSVLLGGTTEGHEPGTNEMYLNLLLPRGAEVTRFEYFGGESPYMLDSEASYPVAWNRFHVVSGETAVIEIAYEVPKMVVHDLFELTLFPHPMVNPDRYYVTVIPPDGYGVRVPDSYDPATTTFQQSGQLIEPVTVELELVEG